MANQSDLDDVARQVLAIASKVKGAVYDGQSSASRLSVLARAQSEEAVRLAGRLEALKFSPREEALSEKGQALTAAVSNLKMWCDNVATSVEGNGNAGTSTELASYSTNIADKLRTAAPTVPVEEERFKVTQKLVAFTEKAKAKQAAALAAKAEAARPKVVVVHADVPTGMYRYEWDGGSWVGPRDYYNEIRGEVVDYLRLRSDPSLKTATKNYKNGWQTGNDQMVLIDAAARREVIIQQLGRFTPPPQLAGFRDWLMNKLSDASQALRYLAQTGDYQAFHAKSEQIGADMARVKKAFGIR